jgi:drug/metabolite transporter (DMT)-like permease
LGLLAHVCLLRLFVYRRLKFPTDVTIRAIGKRASAMHSIASFALQCVLFALPLSAVTHERWVLPTNTTFLLLLPAIGISGFLAQTLLTLGLQRETAGRGAVGLYTQVIFAVFLEWAVFGVLPRGWSVVGMSVVVGCAGYVAVSLDALIYFIGHILNKTLHSDR